MYQYNTYECWLLYYIWSIEMHLRTCLQIMKIAKKKNRCFVNFNFRNMERLFNEMYALYHLQLMLKRFLLSSFDRVKLRLIPVFFYSLSVEWVSKKSRIFFLDNFKIEYEFTIFERERLIWRTFIYFFIRWIFICSAFRACIKSMNINIIYCVLQYQRIFVGINL